MIIIPAIDLKNGRCVRLEQGDFAKETIFSDNPADQAKKWESAGAKIIHIVDLDGAIGGSPKNGKVIEKICRSANCGVQLGGGIRDMQTAQRYFDLGLARIVLGTLLIKNRHLAREIAEKFPRKVLAGIDAKNGKVTGDGWTTSSDLTAKELAEKLEDWPLAGIVYTDISRDGMMQGPNLGAIRDMAGATSLPLIASGGISSKEDLSELSKIPNVQEAIVGKALYTGAINLEEVFGEFQC